MVFEPITLFFGSLMDALIGPNLFVPGEPFLIAAGYQLHQGVWLGVFAVLLGGLIGDQASYWIGRKLGPNALRKLVKWQPKTRRPIARSRRLLFKKGNSVLMFARLLGPIAWVVPFIAGAHRITWKRFSMFSSIGLLLGVGQFVAWGYLLSYGIKSLPWLNQAMLFINEHLYSFLVVAATIVVFALGYRRGWRFLYPKVAVVFLCSALFANYAHFFWRADDIVNQQDKTQQVEMPPMLTSLSQAQGADFKVYPGRSGVFDAQAMNIAFLGESPRQVMLELGWIENQTFSRDDIDWKDYVGLMKSGLPPVSDLYWRNQPQDMAFQLPGDLLKRSHIRWWNAGVDAESGNMIWLGALSYDDGLTMTPYSGIVTVLHSVDPDVDAERDRLAAQISEIYPQMAVSLSPLSEAIVLKDEEHDYHTDGNVLVMNMG